MVVTGVEYSYVAGLDSLEWPMTSAAVGQELEFRNRAGYAQRVS